MFVKGNSVEENEDDCSFPTFDIPKVLLGQHCTWKGLFFVLDEVEDDIGNDPVQLAVFIWIKQFG